MYHAIIHFEIPAENVEKLRKFYTQLFGWKIEKTEGPVDYWSIETVPFDERDRLESPGCQWGDDEEAESRA